MKNTVENAEKPERVALYIRVSTEEQAMHGYSLEAQKEVLTQYARENGLIIVDYYQDEGKSARKSYKTRPECMRMLSDVKAGKIDTILFVKLDRWFRNVGEYYKVQEILEKHHVNWRTVLEDYETYTAAGRLKINIMLSVAQDEADRASERIKFIFESKVARGEVITGAVPKGFKIERGHLVHDPDTADIIRDMFQYYAEHGSKHATSKYMFDIYSMAIDRHSIAKMLSNTIYKGEFRGNVNYCEPLIAPDLFDRISTLPKARNNPTGRIYIFSGLVICAECGYHMNARMSQNRNGNCVRNIYYRCNRYGDFRSCANKRMANEKNIEQWLLENVEREIQNYLIAFEVRNAKAKHSDLAADRAEIKCRLSRLKDLYIIGAIDMDTYMSDYEKYNARLLRLQDTEQDKPKANIPALQDFLAGNVLKVYDTLDRNSRRILWRSILKEIRIDSQRNITVFF